MHLEWAWIWLALPPLLVWVLWLSRRSYADLRPWVRRACAGVRVLVLICLLGALSRPVWVRHTDGQHLLFLLDVSRSVSRDNLEAALTDIDHLAGDATRAGHRVSVIAFGRQARLLIASERTWNGWTEPQRDLVLHETALPGLHARRTQLVSEGAPRDVLDTLQQHVDE